MINKHMKNHSIYYKYCQEILKEIFPNKKFMLKFISRIDWQNLVFCAKELHSNLNLGIKLFCKSFNSYERYSKEVHTNLLLENIRNSYIDNAKILYYKNFDSEIVEGVIIQPWIKGKSFMELINEDFDVFIGNYLIYLEKSFNELWSLKFDYNQIPFLKVCQTDINHPSLLKYKLGCSVEKAFEYLYKRMPRYKKNILRLFDFYSNFQNNDEKICLVNGDPSAHEFIFENKTLKWIDWEYIQLGNPMIDIAYMYYSLAHNFYTDTNKINKLENCYFNIFDIQDISMFIFYFIEKIVIIENTTNFANDINILRWSIDYANTLINRLEK